MYKVIIADDELLLLEGIRDFVDWHALGAEIVYMATNGVDALKYLKENTVDILITDICMPGIDGIELAKYIYENKIGTKVIFLTSYPNFEYVKSGMNYEIAAYVLKDEYMDELEDVIKKVISKLGYRNKTLNEYINLFILRRGSQEDKENFTLIWNVDEYVCMLIKLESDKRFDFSDTVNEIVELNFKNDNVVVNTLTRQDYLCLLPADTGELAAKCEKTVSDIENACKASCKIGISNKCDDIFKLHEKLLETDDAVNNITDSGVMFYKNTASNNLIKKAVAVIESKYAEPISLSRIAGEIGVSSSYLSRKFNDEKGCTITDFINRVRVNNAVKLLQSTDMLVYEIAEKVGIEDAAYFTNTFKKYVGISPQKYKKEFFKNEKN